MTGSIHGGAVWYCLYGLGLFMQVRGLDVQVTGRARVQQDEVASAGMVSHVGQHALLNLRLESWVCNRSPQVEFSCNMQTPRLSAVRWWSPRDPALPCPGAGVPKLRAVCVTRASCILDGHACVQVRALKCPYHIWCHVWYFPAGATW